MLSSTARRKVVLRGTMDEAVRLGSCADRTWRYQNASQIRAALLSNPVMGEPSGLSRRETRTREEHHPGKRRLTSIAQATGGSFAFVGPCGKDNNTV